MTSWRHSKKNKKGISFLPEAAEVWISQNQCSVSLQKLHSFHSLSCPGITGEETCESEATPPPRSVQQRDAVDSPAHEHNLKDFQPQEGDFNGNKSSDPITEEVDWNCDDGTPETSNGKDTEPLWVGLCSMKRDVYQLGGELDIEQIERN